MAEERTVQARAPRRRSPLMGLLVVGLAIGLVWLLAERNARQWWLVPEDGKLVVKKGILFVTGKSTFKSSDPELARTYAPVAPPEGAPVPPERSFDDRAALDQALFDVLASWAREDIRADTPPRMERARSYLQRAGRLSGLTGAQRDALRALHVETAFQEATGWLQQAAEALRRAGEGFKAAAEGRGAVAAEAASLARAVEPLVAGANGAMLEATRYVSDRHRATPAPPGGPAPAAPPGAPQEPPSPAPAATPRP